MYCSAVSGVFGSVGKCILGHGILGMDLHQLDVFKKNYYNGSFKEDFIPLFILLLSFFYPLFIILLLFSTTNFYLHQNPKKSIRIMICVIYI